MVSEITESNGSSSRAEMLWGIFGVDGGGSTYKIYGCGYSYGASKKGDTFTVLTDIQGLEDHLGDMDFKVAGTKKGITAIQDGYKNRRNY